MKHCTCASLHCLMLKELEILGVVCFYTATAITSIIVNKHFLKRVEVPLMFLLFQMVVSSSALILGFVVLRAYKRMSNNARLNDQKRLLQHEKPKRKNGFKTILRSLWPMIVCNVFGLAFNIICLSKMDAIMHQVTRGITLPLTALLGPILGNHSGGWRVFLVCFTIFSGFVIAVSGEASATRISFSGIAAGLISSLIAAYNTQFIKNRFDNTAFSALDLVYYNNIFSTALLAPIALAYEGRQLSSIQNWNYVFVAAVITGLLGVLINYAGFLQIKVTSAVTHCVSSAARGVLQVGASCLLLKERLSLARSIGISLSLLASSLYPVVKNYDNKLQKANCTACSSLDEERKQTKGYKEIPEIEVDEVLFNKIQISGTSK